MNEEASIGAVLDEVAAALADFDGGYEVLVVDTNSGDRTVEIARSKGARVVREPRRGYGRAYKTGFSAARGDLVATLDADMTYPAERIPAMAAMVEEGADFVTGNRLADRGGEAMRGMHLVGNQMLSFTARLLFRVPFHDSQSGMWVFRRDILPGLDLVSDGMAFSEEIKIEAHRQGFRVKEVPIAYRRRVGEAKIRSVADAWENLLFLFKKRFGWTRGVG
jgi:glycosyltransferase involved in cell wall biosynthesis